jgi:hypothetical protein
MTSLIVKGLAILAMIAAFWWAWEHYVAAPYIAKGVVKEKVKTDVAVKRADNAEGANVTLGRDVASLRTKAAAQNASIAAAAKADAVVQGAKNQALSTFVPHTSQIQSLTQAAKTRSATKAQADEKATQILHALALDQLRADTDHPAAK